MVICPKLGHIIMSDNVFWQLSTTQEYLSTKLDFFAVWCNVVLRSSWNMPVMQLECLHVYDLDFAHSISATYEPAQSFQAVFWILLMLYIHFHPITTYPKAFHYSLWLFMCFTRNSSLDECSIRLFNNGFLVATSYSIRVQGAKYPLEDYKMHNLC